LHGLLTVQEARQFEFNSSEQIAANPPRLACALCLIALDFVKVPILRRLMYTSPRYG
jgi:hypothetical protein